MITIHSFDGTYSDLLNSYPWERVNKVAHTFTIENNIELKIYRR